MSNLSEGQHQYAVNIVSDESHAVLCSSAGELIVQDETGSVELFMPVSIVFPAPGKYTVTLHLNGTETLSRTLRVKSMTESQGEER